MRPNLPIVSLTGTSGGKLLGTLSNLEMNVCYSYGVIASFGLKTVVFGGGGGKGTDIGVMALMGGGDVSSSLLRNQMLSIFMERGIHPSMPMGMFYKYMLGYICYIYILNEWKQKQQSATC